MAKLVKLSLMGVRSFGPSNDDEQKIVFAQPLTLFLGQNGCGKTSIIESLKFACTDDLPGGTGGGRDFVNDPSLSGSTSTKGVIKLEIANANGETVTIVRVFSVEYRAKTANFQRLDNSVVYNKKAGVSNKNAEMKTMKVDQVVHVACSILGVSKPIINHVLFCHQEDSLWPLDAPKTVKETFDKIFDSAKYNKAIEYMRTMTKKSKLLLKTYIDKREGFKRDKKLNEEERHKLNEKEEKYAKLLVVITDNEAKLKPIQDKLKELSGLEDSLNKLEKASAAKDQEAKGIDKQIQEIKGNLTEEYKGSDVALQKDIDSFQEVEQKWKLDLETLSKTKDKLTAEDSTLERDLRNLQESVAKLKSAIDGNSSQIHDRNKLISNCESEFKIPHNSVDSSPDVLVAISNLQEAYKRLEDDTNKSIQQQDEEECKLQETSEGLLKDVISAEQQIKLKTEQISKVKKECMELQDQLQDLKVSNEKMKQFEMELNRLNKEIDRISQSFQPEVVERNIATKKREIRELKSNLEGLEHDYDVLRENHATEKVLQNLECSVVAKQTEIEKIKNKHSAYFETVFQNKTDNFKEVVTTMLKQNSTKINAISQKINTTQKKLTQQETICTGKKTKLNDLIQDRDSCDLEVKTICKGKAYEVLRKELEEQVENLQRDKGQYSSAKIIYNKFIREFEGEKPCCPVCSTDFKDRRSTVVEVIKTLKSRIHNIPEDLKIVSEKLRDTQEQFNKVVKLEATYKRVQELTTKIDEIKIEITESDAVIVSEKKVLVELQAELREPEKAKEIADKLIGDSALLDKSYKDLKSYDSERSTLQNQLITINSDKSMEDTKAEISELKDNISRLEHDSELEQKKLLQNRNKLQELKDRRAAENEKKLGLQKNMQGQPQLEEQYVKLQNDQDTLLSEIEDMSVKLANAKELHDDASSNYELVKASNKADAAERRRKLGNQKRMVENIEEVHKKIEQFETKGVDQLYSKAKEDGETLQTKKTNIASECEQIIKEKTEIEKKIVGQKHELRKLQDNHLLREKVVLRDGILAESEVLKNKIAGQNCKKIHDEKSKLSKDWQEFSAEIGKCKGQRDELKISIEELQTSLNRPENKNAHRNHLTMCYKVAALQLSLNDLMTFMRAIEESIMNFHTERMKQINNIIRNLWRAIYQGNDVESIRIKTDKIISTDVRRNYNYSVMQVKNGIEIEMRGRCSAGQKVLACLIIRMALAETFSLHCGILALDEPTTNLDRQNIVSLSDALVKLIEERASDKNFQLLVITHDEEFLTALQRASKDTFYYNVTRNHMGFTRIEKKNSF